MSGQERWEYHMVGEPRIRAEELWEAWVAVLDALGQEGWEVVGWTGLSAPALLKRRLPADEGPADS